MLFFGVHVHGSGTLMLEPGTRSAYSASLATAFFYVDHCSMTSEARGQVKVLWSSLFRVKVSRVKENNITFK